MLHALGYLRLIAPEQIPETAAMFPMTRQTAVAALGGVGTSMK